MDKNKIKKIAIICVLVIVCIVCGGFGVYKYSEVQAYNNLITTANKDIDQGEYEQAIALFNQSLQYKDDANVKNNIKLATNLKDLKPTFDEGTKLMNNKDYLGAIEQFKKVTKEDDKLYSNAQKEIQECAKKYIAQNIQLANSAVKNAKYDEANKYLDGILKIDSNNAEAKKSKDDVEKSIREQKDKAVVKSNAQTEAKTNAIQKDEYTEDMAIKLAEEYECRVNAAISAADFNSNGDIAVAFYGFEDHNGITYGGVRFASKKMMADGGTGTIDNIYIAKDGTVYSSTLNGN